jgi:S1-C subfamily serine protease
VTVSALRGAAAACLLILSMAGCSLAPVPPPSTDQPTQTQSAASTQPLTVQSPVVAPTAVGFSRYEKAALRIRNIGCGVSSGSGFAIGDHLLVTNRHVIGGAAVLQISTYDGRDIEVNAVGAAVVADLALVWTKEELPATIRLAQSNPVVGTTVSVVGYPLGGQLTTTKGRVLRYGPDPIGWSSLPMIYSDAPIEHGSSGSPVVDAGGLLVGVVYALAQGEAVFVPVETLAQVISDPARYSNGSKCDGQL